MSKECYFRESAWLCVCCFRQLQWVMAMRTSNFRGIYNLATTRDKKLNKYDGNPSDIYLLVFLNGEIEKLLYFYLFLLDFF